MDDAVLRPRYPRSRTYRRRRKNTREALTFKQKFALQVIICIAVLGVIVGAKNIDSPITNFVTSAVKDTVSQDIELKAFYDKLDGTIKEITGNRRDNSIDQSDFEEEAVPASAQPDTVLPGDSGGTGLQEEVLSGESTDSQVKEGDTESSAKKEVTEPKDTVKDNVQSQKTSRSGEEAGSVKNPVPGVKLLVPVAGFLGSPYGERMHPLEKVMKFHRGIDIEANNGDSIKAALAGEVIESGTEKTFGNYLKLKHSDGLETVYAHCSVLLSKKGQKVKQGEVIARVGSTGAAVGSHLHFEVWKDGKTVDPLAYIKVPTKK